jgi:hypothetical protein
VIALAMVGLALAAGGPLAAADLQPTTYVVVDPNEFRQPVPDPQAGLSQKYDGKVVRFNGVVRDVGQNKKTKLYSYTMTYDIVTQVRKGKTTQVNRETIVVSVHFQKDEKQLRQALRAQKKSGVPLTVQGTGAVGTDGSLSISSAVIVPAKGFAK